MPDLRVSIGGDPEGGWLLDIHDGEKHASLRPKGKTLMEALLAGLEEFSPDLKPLAEIHEAQQSALEALNIAQADLASKSDTKDA